MTDLTGKTALITGASSGLGAHFARVMASAGAQVILAARRESALTEVCQAVATAGGQARTLRLDVTDAASIAALADSLKDVDVLINNAGVVSNAPALQQTEADWDAVLDTNLERNVFARSSRRPEHA